MQFIDKGTYARVYYDKKKRIVVKELELKSGKYVEATSIADLAFHMSLSGLYGVPEISDYKISDKKISLSMPHYGRTLHEVGRKLSRKELASVMVQLCDINQQLLDAGIMHIDIKPANILYKDGKVTLIDFNLMSFKFWNNRNSEYEWIDGVGTWCYCAPEVILHKKPMDSSVVWSLAMVWMECVLGRMAIHRDLFKKNGDSSRRTSWVKCINILKKECADHYPVPNRYAQELNTEDYDLFCYFMNWDPMKRPSLAEFREIFQNRLPEALAPIPEQMLMASNIIERVPEIYDFCENELNGRYSYLYDRAVHYSYRYNRKKTLIVYGACIILALWLEGSYIFDDDVLSEALIRCFGPRADLEKKAFQIGELMRWRLYVPVTKPFILI